MTREPTVTAPVARRALDLLHIDAYGLDKTDRAILRLISQQCEGGPVGLSTLAAALGEDAETIETVYEPYLLREGFLKRTPRGRETTTRVGAVLTQAQSWEPQ